MTTVIESTTNLQAVIARLGAVKGAIADLALYAVSAIALIVGLLDLLVWRPF